MATKRFIGSAPKTAQVVTLVPGGTIEADDVFNVTVGGKTVSVVAGSTVAATVAATIQAALAASTYGEFLEVTWTVNSVTITGTANTPGKPFTISVETTETGGGLADTQTFTLTTTTASTSPNDWNNTQNWDTGTLPVDTDDVILDRETDILYGLDQSAIDLASLTILPSFGRAKLGLPEHTGSYAEYRPTALSLTATAVSIECDSGRIKLNLGSVQTAVTVKKTGAAGLEPGLEALLLKATHASNTALFLKGSIGIAVLKGSDVATFSVMQIGYVSGQSSDVRVRCGSGVTLTTVEKHGGFLSIQSNINTINHYGGDMEVLGTATIATLTGFGGIVRHKSSGTITALLSYGDDFTIDFTGDPRSRTVTTTNRYGRGKILDPQRVVTWTNGIDLEGGSDLTGLSLGTNIKISVANVT